MFQIEFFLKIDLLLIIQFMVSRSSILCKLSDSPAFIHSSGGSIKVRNRMLYIAVVIGLRGAPPLEKNCQPPLIPKEQKYI